MPKVSALIAWAPPTKYVSLIPNSFINFIKYGLIDLVGGVIQTILFTPAMIAGTAFIIKDEG